MLLNLGYNLWTDTPQVPWAVLPMTLNAFGIALVFPIVTLAILDMYPRQRGSASSMQAFTSLVLNAVIAGVLSPWISDHMLWMVGVASAFLLVAWGFWRWEARVTRTRCAVEPGATVPEESL